MAGRPTMEDVAREAGVSRSLVSLVFQDSPKVHERSRARVLDAAARLNYRPNALARSLASTRTQTLGIVLDDLHNPYFADALGAVQDAAEASGHRTLLADGRRSGERELDAVRTFIDHRVDGVILVSPRAPEADLGALARTTPLVALERRMHAPHVDLVMHDDSIGCHLVVQHLVGLGHRHICHVDGGVGAGAANRREAYRAAMVAADLGRFVDIVEGEYTEAAGREAAAALLRRRNLPTAVFCANDFAAAGVAAVFMREGISIPREVSLVGYDDTSLAGLDVLSLTSVRQPLAAMAHTSIELIGKRLETPGRRSQRLELPPDLVVRRSTAAVRGR